MLVGAGGGSPGLPEHLAGRLPAGAGRAASTLLLLPDWYVGFCRMGMLSPEGRCRAFDAGAGGFVRSEGAGMVVLKPLAQALADGDRVYAIIRGTAMNQDGRTPGMTVPSQEAQEALLRQACRDAGVSAGGDPVRRGPRHRHARGRPDRGPGTGSGLVRRPARERAVPDRLGEDEHRPPRGRGGHRRADQGRAGALPSPHSRATCTLIGPTRKSISTRCDFACRRAASRGRPATAQPWRASTPSALAAPMHMSCLQEAPHAAQLSTPGGSASSQRPFGHSLPDGAMGRNEARSWLIPLSARGPEALRAAARSWDEFLAQCPDDVSLEEIAANAALRRTHHDHRLASRGPLEGKSWRSSLREFAPGRGGRGRGGGTSTRPTGGRGSRLSARGRARSGGRWAGNCCDQEPVFRAAIEQCDAIVRQLGDWSLPGRADGRVRSARAWISLRSRSPASSRSRWRSPSSGRRGACGREALVGHSVGEVAAAYLAGVFSLEDAVRIIYHRGRTMELAPGRGRMLAAAHPAGRGPAT